MGLIRKLLFVGVGVFALHGLQACSTETELNPQPLPPGSEPARSPEPEGAADDKTGGPNGGSSGTNPPPLSSDAGTEGGDASEGGDG